MTMEPSAAELERKALKKARKAAKKAAKAQLDGEQVPSTSSKEPAAATNGTSTSGNQSDEAEPQRKRARVDSASDIAGDAKLSKKERKRLRAEQAQAAATTSTLETTTSMDEQAKKSKKKDKKQKQQQPADAAEQEEQQPLKKQKKQAAPAATPAALQQEMAAVGDVALAKAGRPILKQLYSEHPDVTRLTDAQVDAARLERGATIEGASIRPVTEFEHTGLPPAMLHATRAFVAPSPIQSQCWPVILSGRDLVGIAATGSGKTLGFGLPMMRHICAQKEGGVVRGKGPFAIVMAPTRELACQIAEVLEDAGSRCGVSCVCVYGGVPKGPQVQALKRGVDVVVGTPGRLEDLMGDGVCRLNEVTYLVLDEADRMLDLGFEPHIRAICSTVRADRQTLMFSATWPSAVQKLASNFLASPVKVTIGSHDLSASHSVTQVVEVIDPAKRDERLLALLAKYHKSRTNRILIFVLYKKEAPRVEALLTKRGWAAGSVHGDISQGQRTASVEAFKDGSVPLLIATDVAARGLDIPDVEHVINYSFPLTIEDYVHRIGRTGRAGKSGHAHTFFSAGSDKPRAGELMNVLREAGQTVPEELLKFGTTVKKKEHKLYGAHFKDVDFNAKATKITFDD